MGPAYGNLPEYSLPFKGRAGWGWVVSRGLKPIPIPTFPLKGKEQNRKSRNKQVAGRAGPTRHFTPG
ncbi:hypothetical protein D3870_05355 [Noviherbaspirillum cavernae]|uniref:Uncharacterized protein n=1 Tax=Noviherbaspirillum cavernae TaxID=2320862 RepID=A0A418WZ71_9BURK|nr:hypothetical protein D3870_05355 [Noviherbaspirillum cavernae]